MKKTLPVMFVIAAIAVGCGWTRHNLSPTAKAVKITKAEPMDSCEMVGTFFTYKDCIKGPGRYSPDEDAQMECIKWKADSVGGNWAVLDGIANGGYYKGRVYHCPAD